MLYKIDKFDVAINTDQLLCLRIHEGLGRLCLYAYMNDSEGSGGCNGVFEIEYSDSLEKLQKRMDDIINEINRAG